MKRVITYGTFDMLHNGHINLLKRAKRLGDYLIVGVTSEQYDFERGKLNVEESLEERMRNVEKTGLANQIIVELHDGQKVSDVQKHKADIFTIGSDWEGKFDYLNEYCSVVYLPRTPNISSTELRNEQNGIINIGIIGSGRIAERFIPESKFVSGCQVEGVCSLGIEGARSFAKKFELNFYTDKLETLLDKVDAVYIATPHGSHFQIARQALLSGKHVLCEKPMTLNANDLHRLFEIADSQNLVIIEGIKTAYSPGYIRLIETIKSGVIGNVRDVEASFTKLVSGNVRELDPNTDGGSVNELATYPLLAIFQVLGKPNNIKFYSHISNNIDLFTKGIIEFDNAIASFKVGLGVKTEGDMVVSGDRGYVYVPAPWWKTEYFEIRYEDSNENHKYFYKFKGDGLRYELAEFLRLIKDGEKESWKIKRDINIYITETIERYHNMVRDNLITKI